MKHVPVVLIAGLAFVLTGCTPGGTPAPPETPSPTPSVTESATPKPDPITEISLPADCAELFDADFVAEMTSYHQPLNDPGLSMESTDLAAGQAILAAQPHLRCTWGVPSEVGIATSVALVTPAQQAEIITEAQAGGFSCVTVSSQETRCTLSVYEEDDEWGAIAYGADHVLRDNAWVATQWLNIEVPDYTDRIVAALWD